MITAHMLLLFFPATAMIQQLQTTTKLILITIEQSAAGTDTHNDDMMADNQGSAVYDVMQDII